MNYEKLLKSLLNKLITDERLMLKPEYNELVFKHMDQMSEKDKQEVYRWE